MKYSNNGLNRMNNRAACTSVCKQRLRNHQKYKISTSISDVERKSYCKNGGRIKCLPEKFNKLQL